MPRDFKVGDIARTPVEGATNHAHDTRLIPVEVELPGAIGRAWRRFVNFPRKTGNPA
jgi:hypothetical protein